MDKTICTMIQASRYGFKEGWVNVRGIEPTLNKY